MLTDLGVNPSTLLGVCEGDCDTDANCEAGLVCFQRSASEPVPGCSGDGSANWDYCVHSLLVDVGGNPTQPLGACEGDCDTDAECEGSLTCFQRTGSEPVPGCPGQGTASWDYCIDPTFGASTEPSFTVVRVKSYIGARDEASVSLLDEGGECSLAYAHPANYLLPIHTHPTIPLLLPDASR